MTPPFCNMEPNIVAHIIACLFVINICFCIPAMYVFNELQQEGLGAAMLRHALITSVGWLKFRGQTACAKLASVRNYSEKGLTNVKIVRDKK